MFGMSHHVVGIQAAEVGRHFCNPRAHNGAWLQPLADLIAVVAVRLIREFQRKKSRVVPVGDPGDGVLACQELMHVVFVRLHGATAMSRAGLNLTRPGLMKG